MDERKTGVTAATDVVELGKGPPRDSIIAGKYQVESTLGFGGMGLVLAARHLQLDERVAIKILRDDVQLEPEHIGRFIREAQAAARLKSENVARVDDVGTLPDGKPYMVMELLEGMDLGRLLQDNGQLARPIAADIVLQVCDALAEAHSHGIVHRDIKPTNLFVTSRRDGSPLIKVLDFGISKAASAGDLSLTQTSSMLGTPAYMSPEQMRSARDVDARSDIWSLGTVLYELLEGTTPFSATNFAELCVAVATENPRDMVNAPEIQPVLARALAKSLEDRFQSIAEFADALVPFTTDPQRAARQVNRIFRLLGMQAPHPGARDSTPVMTATRGSAPQLIRPRTFAGEEASTIANAAPTIAAARRRPLWLVAAGLALLAIGAAVTVIFMTGRDNAATNGSAVVGSAQLRAPGSALTPDESTSAGSAVGSAAVSSGSSAATGSADAQHADTTRSADAGSDAHAGSSNRTVTHEPIALPPPHRPPVVHTPAHHVPPHHPPAVPQAGSAASSPPPPPAPKCDPFANPKGCPKAPPLEHP